MLNRLTLRTTYPQLAESFGITAGSSLELAESIDVVAQQSAPVVLLGLNGERMLTKLKWGMAPVLPYQSNDIMRKLTAETERIYQIPAYRVAIRKFRCLVPADAFSMAPQRLGEEATAFTSRQERPFAFAAIWDRWLYGDEVLDSFSILTVKSDTAESIRLPVILPTDLYSHWLSPTSRSEELLELLRNEAVEEVRRRVIPCLPDNGETRARPAAA